MYTCKCFANYFCTIVHFNFCRYFCGMDGKQLTPQEAFADFLQWVKASGKWDDLNNKDRNRIITARRDMNGKRDSRRLGYERLKSILNDYAPGRYLFSEIVTLIQP